MKREKLRRRIAVCILDTLVSNALTPSNVKRYVTSNQLSLYRIRKQTKITAKDLDTGLRIAKGAIHLKPISFRYAPRGSPIAERRMDMILTAPIADLIKP